MGLTEHGICLECTLKQLTGCDFQPYAPCGFLEIGNGENLALTTDHWPLPLAISTALNSACALFIDS